MKRKLLKFTAVYLAINFLAEIFFPTAAWALTGGPSQPEVTSFEPVGTSEMVDLSSGDFVYNIPLLDVGGYPVNISYHSGVTMDQEASWVGLGWNINVGTINRNMRGLPDDFDGNEVTKKFHMKKNETKGGTLSVGGEIFGYEGISATFGFGVNYNNYVGYGFEQIFNIGINTGKGGKGPLTAGLGIRSSDDGFDMSPSLSFSVKAGKVANSDLKVGGSIGLSINSRGGLKALTMSTNVSRSDNGGEGGETRSLGGTNLMGSSISFANPTYIPQITMPMKNWSESYSGKFGGTIFGFDGTVNLTGYYSSQEIAEKEQKVRAYGYLYAHNGVSQDKALLDFNREKDGAYTENTPCLPVTNLSYDLYTVAGQGVGGMFRPFRSDLGTVFDSRAANVSDGISAGAELSITQLVQAGLDVVINDVNSVSGKWYEDNFAASSLQFRGSTSNAEYEPFYFKEIGEKSVDNSDLYDDILKATPARIKIEESGPFRVKATPVLLTDNSQSSSFATGNNLNYRTARHKRNQLFSFITAEEYSKAALQKSLGSIIYSTNSSNILKCKKHIAEITTYKTDGTRYVYGIPAYNITQKEVTFNINNYPTYDHDCASGLRQYDPASDNSTSNTRDRDEYYNSTELPAYAHSYLLTAVLSADYVDITGNGPSDDDYGNYTKFNYTKVSGSGYNWRVPYEQNKANSNQSLLTRRYDDQGNYVYGNKEIWYLDEIVTKNYKAIFERQQHREDGLGVAGENGGLPSSSNPDQKMKLLSKISLYSRADIAANTLANAIPIKEVHFVYDYSLCQVVDNNPPSTLTATEYYDGTTNHRGKLTLKKLYFTYGKSFKAKLSPYVFTYGSYNPSYGLKAYDRWGNYKRNDCTSSTRLPNSEFPYVDQGKIPSGDPLYTSYPGKTFAEVFTSAWSLTEIDLPSGGKIIVEYEPDDYAYVQNKRAMQMFRITGIGSSSTTNINTLDTDSKLYFDLTKPIKDDADAASNFFNNYLKGVDRIYFRFLINVNDFDGNIPNNGQEYMSGYAELDNTESGDPPYGLVDIVNISGDDFFTRGYIRLKEVNVKDGGGSCDFPLLGPCSPCQCNPIAKASWQFARMNTPKEAYGSGDMNNPNLLDVLTACVGFIPNLLEVLNGGPNCKMRDLGYGKYVYPKTRSNAAQTVAGPASAWVRLLNPNMKKLGGGCRVKKLTVSDEWDAMTTIGSSFSYGQEYSYTSPDPNDPNNPNVSISSGVATYEPLVGADENPWRQPVPFKEENLLAPDNDMYLEEPFGETFFPSPSVTYGRVTVKNLQRANVHRHATGKVVHEFYTSKDFPVFTSRTAVLPIPQKSGLAGSIFKFNFKDYMTTSQGYSIELNDMNGKPKAQWVYAEDQDEPISGVEYKYKSQGNRLVNDATTITKTGAQETKSIGIDFDFVSDMRQEKTVTTAAGVQLNLYSFIIPIIPPLPIFIPAPWPTYSRETTIFRSAVVTKVIFRYGLLEETIAYDLGSRVSTKNIAYDAETGDVLLTRTVNEYDDGIYSLNYPAHWAYDGMGPSYKNIGVVVSGVSTISSGKITAGSTSSLTPGDEVLLIESDGDYVFNNSTDYNFWIDKRNSDFYIIDRFGQPPAVQNGSKLKVIRSGRRNMQVTSVGSTTCVNNPLSSTFSGFTEALGIINSGATIFTDQWKTFCPCDMTNTTVYNPYVKGVLGNWRKKKDFTLLTDRVLARTNGSTDIRRDGLFLGYRPFWTPPATSGDWRMPTDLNSLNPVWTWTSEITAYSPYGFELENRDALGRYSSALYGYNNSLPVAVSSNSRYNEIAFDSFEDYLATYDCSLEHFSYNEDFDQNIIGTESHSGKKSIKVPGGTYYTPVSIRKTVRPTNCPTTNTNSNLPD